MQLQKAQKALSRANILVHGEPTEVNWLMGLSFERLDLMFVL